MTQEQSYSVASQSQMTRHVVIEQRIIRSSDGVIHSETTRTETHMGAAMDSDETLTQAQTAYVNGDYAQAITLAKTAAKTVRSVPVASSDRQPVRPKTLRSSKSHTGNWTRQAGSIWSMCVSATESPHAATDLC